MEDAEHLAATQEQSWEQLRGQDAQPCAEALAAPSAPRVSALQQRFGHRRAMTSIVRLKWHAHPRTILASSHCLVLPFPPHHR